MSKLPGFITDALSKTHPGWRDALVRALELTDAASPGYLEALGNSSFLPTDGKIFAAFGTDPASVKRVLIGESPYPRAESASGYAFMDSAVTDLWSENGLSKKANRATSLRNFVKMALVADGLLDESDTSAAAVARVSRDVSDGKLPLVKTMDELKGRFLAEGFLLLNASLVFRKDVAVAKDVKAWQPFLGDILRFVGERATVKPELVLWGRQAETILKIPHTDRFKAVVSEHPYNLSFISNAAVRDYFAPLSLLKRI